MNQNKEVSELVYKAKYLQQGETFKDGMSRIAGALTESKEDFYNLREILLDQRFLPAGRIQSSVGSARKTTAINCFVSGIVEDSMESITHRLSEALQTMRMGGGIGYDFSNLRPSGSLITTLESSSCGPVGSDFRQSGFMDLFDAGCSVISSAGHRRGAQMAVLRIDHPDIRHFIHAKRTPGRLTNFNVSIAVTDKFMEAVRIDGNFDLVFEGKTFETISARNLWNEVMRSTWDHAEPGILFIDKINRKNNLWYCETISSTNPCAEQPLPPHGACLLGSFNLVKYMDGTRFRTELFKHDIVPIVRAMDNVIEETIYPLPEQEDEEKSKRRMGLGVTGLANAAEIAGLPYGSEGMLEFTRQVMTVLRDTAYTASCSLAVEKGPFPKFNRKMLDSAFALSLPNEIREMIYDNGIRNSHLLSVAPTGTISLAADNVSSGIEPPYMTGSYDRNIYMSDGSKRSFVMQDYAEEKYGIVGRSSTECSVEDHLKVLDVASSLVDSSVSKTCNVGPSVTFEEFKDIYFKAWLGRASGLTTFRPVEFGGKREGVMSVKEGSACFIDEQGNRTCDS